MGWTQRQQAKRLQAFKVIAHPTSTGTVVAVVVSHWAAGRRTDRIIGRYPIDLGDGLPVDEPGPLLLAMSDALADLADKYR